MTIGFNPWRLGATRIIIETGTFRGDFVEKVKGRYGEVHTVEFIEPLYRKACERFKDDAHVHCHLGSSPVVLRKILSEINEPVTFWLDAHQQVVKQAEATKAPLLDELAVIGAHPVKDHIILIDDVRLFRLYRTSHTEVEGILRGINPDYNISYGPGHVDGDVLVAKT